MECNPETCELLKLKEDLSLELNTISDLITMDDKNIVDNCLLIVRNECDSFGEMYYRGVYLCDTLENPDYIIKTGVYNLVYTYSPRFKRFLYEIKGVVGRSRLLIHSGNYMNDSKGCVLVGVRKSMVLQYSVITLNRVNKVLHDCNIKVVKIQNS